MDPSVAVPHLDASPTPRRPTSAPAAARRRKAFSATRHQDPSFWDKEVVYALCTKLPGGLSSVTKACSVCRSVFYPCLCEPPSKHYGLHAPRIIRAAEECRLSERRFPPRQFGSLHCVRSRAERRDMNKNRLVVMGNDGMGFVRRSLKTAQVLDRTAASYLVCGDGGAKIQRLGFTWQELRELEHCLEDHEDKLVVTGCIGSKLVTVRFSTKAQAMGDVVLRRAPLGWEVAEVREGGVAGTAGLCEGHFLAQLEVVDKWQDTWSDQRPPCSFWQQEDPATVEEPDDARAFPCELTFERVPAGSLAMREAAADGSESRLERKRLHQLIAAQQGATIVFERTLQEFVSRDAVLCRHEHLWEKRAEDYTKEEDERLLRHWAFGSHLTLASLSFVFKKLVDMITEEMQRFERAKGLRMRMLLEKCRRCVALQSGEEQAAPIDPVTLEGEIRCVLGEVYAIFEAVPVYFLREIVGEGSVPSSPSRTPSRTSKRPSFQRQGSTCTEMANAIATSEIAHAEPEVFDFLTQEVHKYLLKYKPRDPQMSGSLMFPGSPKRDDRGGSFGERRADPAALRIQRAVARSTNQTKTLSEDELDGKLCVKEFERILIKAGITWLTRSQQKQMFDSLDHDRTGKLNLGEILSSAGRIMDLISRAQSYFEERRKDQKNISQAKALQEYCRNCLRYDGTAHAVGAPVAEQPGWHSSRGFDGEGTKAPAVPAAGQSRGFDGDGTKAPAFPAAEQSLGFDGKGTEAPAVPAAAQVGLPT